MGIPDFEGDQYPVTQSGPIPAMMRLIEVRKIAKDIGPDTPPVEMLAQTIEWLVMHLNNILCDEVPEECEEDCRRCLESIDEVNKWLHDE
jgi:hypothetical protein